MCPVLAPPIKMLQPSPYLPTAMTAAHPDKPLPIMGPRGPRTNESLEGQGQTHWHLRASAYALHLPGPLFA